MENRPDNLRMARRRVEQGKLISGLLEARANTSSGSARVGFRVEAGSMADPVKDAEARYLRRRGFAQAMRLMQGSFDELFPAASGG